MTSLRRTLRRSSLAGLAAAVLTVAAPASSASAADCDKVVAPGNGSAQRMVDSLVPGQTGCLRGGRFSENLRVNDGGTSDSQRITIQSYPGEQAELYGRLYVPDESNFVTVRGLKLNGKPAPEMLPSPTVNGDDIIFEDNDVTNENWGICFNLGNESYGTAKRVIIRRNRIHHCGQLPANNHEHGIYLTESEDVQVLDNFIYDNADRGIQLYPNADRTIIRGNVIDGNGVGVIFSGVGGSTSDDNIVENNVITNSNIRRNVESWWPEGEGTGNVARNNCIHGGRLGNVGSQDGFVATRNLVVDPLFVDRGAKDFRLRPGSPCADVLAGAEVPPAPLDPTSRPGGEDDSDDKAPVGTGAGDEDAPAADEPTAGKPGKVVLENVSVKRSSRRGRVRVRVAGRISGDAPRNIKVQVRRGGSWKTIGMVPSVQGTFRVVLRAKTARLQSADRMTVRIVVPGTSTSNSMHARLR